MTKERAIELLKEIQFCCDLENCRNAWDCEECDDALNMAIKVLKQLSLPRIIIGQGEKEPSVVPKRGKWGHYLKEGLKWKCSECGSKYTTWHYCPNCGAKMETEQ